MIESMFPYGHKKLNKCFLVDGFQYEFSFMAPFSA